MESQTLSDKEILDWLSERAYINATDAGNDDPRQFHYHASMEQHTLREALSAHIQKTPRKLKPVKYIALADVKLNDKFRSR